MCFIFILFSFANFFNLIFINQRFIIIFIQLFSLNWLLNFSLIYFIFLIQTTILILIIFLLY